MYLFRHQPHIIPCDSIFLPRDTHKIHINDAPLPRKHYKSWEIIVHCPLRQLSFTQLIYRHLQLVQTGNVSRRKAETWHQNKPGDSISIQCMHFTSAWRQKCTESNAWIMFVCDLTSMQWYVPVPAPPKTLLLLDYLRSQLWPAWMFKKPEGLYNSVFF